MHRIFRISLNLFYSIEKSRIVLGQRGFEKIFLGLLRLDKFYLHHG